MVQKLTYSNTSDQELYLNSKIHIQKRKIKISAATIASSAEKPNEDAFAIVCDDSVLFAAVFDGTTSLKPIKSLGDITGARFASHFLKDNFTLAKKSISPKELLLKLNENLLEKSLQFEGATITDTHTLPSSTGTIIKIDIEKNTFSFAHVSDSYGIVYHTDESSQIFTDDRNSKFDDRIFALVAQIAREKGISPRKARDDEKVKKALIHMFIERNNNPHGKGCGVINGDPQVEQYIQTGTVPLQKIRAILLGTDGLTPVGWSEKKEADQQNLYKEILDGGFQNLCKTKKLSEDNDPDWQNIRYKHSDDATGILIEF